MKERLKLKRGLSDISPLFTKSDRLSQHLAIREPENVLGSSAFDSYPEIIFSWSSEDEADAHFLNNFFASKLVSPHSPGLLMTVGNDPKANVKVAKSEPWSRSLRRLFIPVSKIEEAFASDSLNSLSEFKTGLGAHIFLEMKMGVLLKHPDMVKSLDRIVLFMHPQVDSITETYRKLKKLVLLGLSAEIEIVFDADDAAGLSARVYELFSDFISKRLSLSVNYLGTLHLSRGQGGLAQDLRWENWEQGMRAREVSIEKLRFLSWIEKMQEISVCR